MKGKLRCAATTSSSASNPLNLHCTKQFSVNTQSCALHFSYTHLCYSRISSESMKSIVYWGGRPVP